MYNPPSCPECVAGKCGNCDGTTWYDVIDALTYCPHATAGHAPAAAPGPAAILGTLGPPEVSEALRSTQSECRHTCPCTSDMECTHECTCQP